MQSPEQPATPTNRAAWVLEKVARPLVVRDTPYTKPGENQVVVRNHAVAVNPVDAALQANRAIADNFTWVTYPAVFGCDVAGVVEEVGPGVDHLRPGDRVLACAAGIDLFSTQGPAEGGFQLYTVVHKQAAVPIPPSLPFEQACVLPICFATASSALFSKSQLALPYPTVRPAAAPAGKETVIIWGASTSVGCNAVQLAAAAGFDVFATASPRNFALVRRLGATQVFDYASPTVVPDMLAALAARKCAGAVAIGKGSATACVEVVGAAAMTRPRKYVAQVSPDAALAEKCKALGVESSFVWGTEIPYKDAAGAQAIFGDFLPAALASGTYVAAPEAEVVGHGLEHVQAALDAVAKGVSAKKLVVTL